MKKLLLTLTLTFIGLVTFSQYQEGRWKAKKDVVFDLDDEGNIIQTYQEQTSSYYFDITLNGIYSNFPVTGTTYYIDKRTKIAGKPVFYISNSSGEQFLLAFFNEEFKLRFISFDSKMGMDFLDCTVNGKKELSKEDPMKNRRKYADDGQDASEAYDRLERQRMQINND